MPDSTPAHPVAILVLGDQLSEACGAFAGQDPALSVAVMSERAQASLSPRSTLARSGFFLAAMRRFAHRQRQQGWRVAYRTIVEPGETSLAMDLARLSLEAGALRARCAHPGCATLKASMEQAFAQAGLALEWVEDGKFLFPLSEAMRMAAGPTQPMESFYRQARVKLGLLMQPDGSPVGDRWNFDADNRKGYGRAGPPKLPELPRFEPQASDLQAFADLRSALPDLPGSLDGFSWPLDPASASRLAQFFLDTRLPSFGRFQDAMWQAESSGSHSMLSTALNAGLLDPLELCRQAQDRWRRGLAPLESVEGFIRQVIGWREYMRARYWQQPSMGSIATPGRQAPLPAMFWAPERSKMACMRECLGQSLRTGYAHHIQRLMVIGNFARVAGLDPRELDAWFGGVYADALPWAHTPNVMGMSQGAAPGVATKPYASAAAYIKRQSNYCSGCAYDPDKRTEDDACPFNALYWDTCDREIHLWKNNPRTAPIAAQWEQKNPELKAALKARAAQLRGRLDEI